jgi:hypothetical protein
MHLSMDPDLSRQAGDDEERKNSPLGLKDAGGRCAIETDAHRRREMDARVVDMVPFEQPVRLHTTGIKIFAQR